MKVTWKKAIASLSILTLILGGCSAGMDVSAEEIVHNAIESDNEIDAYYGEAEMKLFDGEEMMQDTEIEEYVSEDGKRKVITHDKQLDQESIALNDGEKLIVYDKGTEEVYEMEMDDELSGLASTSPKEQLKTMIESMENSHEYEVVGEEKVLDMDTFHIKMKAKEKDNLFGDIELWIDQKTWLILKMISETGDMRTEMEYTKLDFSPDFSEDTFTIDIPEGTESVNLEDMYAPDSVSLEEAENALGQPFLTFPEEDITLSNVELYDFSEEMERYEVDLQYSSSDEVPMFSISVFPTPEDMPINEGDKTIRGTAAEYDDMINGIIWDEDGLRYSLLILNPDVKVEDIEKLTEEMVLSSEQ